MYTFKITAECDYCAFYRMVLVIESVHYIHFQSGQSALSLARCKRLPEIEKLLVKYGAKEVSLYLNL